MIHQVDPAGEEEPSPAFPADRLRLFVACIAESSDRAEVDTVHGPQRQGTHPVPCSGCPDTPWGRYGASYRSAGGVAVAEDDVVIAPGEGSVVVRGDCIVTCCDVSLSKMAAVVEVADPTFGNAADNCMETVVQRSRRVEGWEIDGAFDRVGSTAAYLVWVIGPGNSADAAVVNMRGEPSSAMEDAAGSAADRLPSCHLTPAEVTAKID